MAPTPAPTVAPTPAPTVAPTPAPTPDPTVFYLSPTGNDAGSGSITSPWRSIYTALGRLQPGNTLYVRGGAYSFGGVNYTTVAGTASQPILVAAYPGETPVFTGTTTPADFLYFSGSSAYVTLRGLTVGGGGATSDANGSSLLGFVNGANHITIQSMHLVGAAGWTAGQHLAYVAATSVNHITFTGNVFDGKGCLCGGLLQFYHDPNAASVTVSGNTFANADQGLMIWAGVTGLTVSNNTFSGMRIAVRYHNSGGTNITGNTGSGNQSGLYTDTTAGLTQSGNSW
jgi:hypothetical protein